MSDKLTPEEKGYLVQRERAQWDKIMASARRKKGHVDPRDPESMPTKTDAKYDPRKR